jgi:hypothetical protein
MRIRIQIQLFTLIWFRIQLLTLIRFRIQLITLIRIWIQLITLMGIWMILPFSLMRIRIHNTVYKYTCTVHTQTEALNLKISGFIQADNAPTCGVAEWVHSLAAQLSQAPQLAAYHQILSTDHELR